MRRRERDVFELGEEELLDEPAVELVEPEGPPAPPPVAGSASEATGPEEPRGEAVETATTQPRVPSLDGVLRWRRAASAGLASLALGAAALIGIRASLEDLAPDRGLMKAEGRPHEPRGPAAGDKPAEDSRHKRDAEPPPERSATVSEPAPSNTPAPIAETPPSPEPDPVENIATPPASPAPQEATPEVVSREFGL